MKKLPKAGEPSDRPLVVVIRYLSRAFAALRRRTSAASIDVPSPTPAPLGAGTVVAAVGVANN